MSQAPEPRPQAGPAPDMSLYQRLIDDGVAEARRRGVAVDHLTARRLAIWLAAQPQPPAFAEALAHFTQTGAFSRQLLEQVRDRARSPNSPYHSQAARLLHYCVSRGPDRGPIGADFAAACDQIDQADTALADLRDRVKRGVKPPEQASRAIIAHADLDPRTRMVTFSMDETTAGIAITAIVAHAGDRETYAHDVLQFSQGLPQGSYGRQNREAIAAREAQAAARLRNVERAYQIAMGHAAAAAPEPATTHGDPGQVADREIELE
jgi:hypothetical protein